MKNKNAATAAILIALVLVSAAGLGYGIRQIRWSLASRKDLPESKLQAKVVVSEPEAEIIQEPEPEPESEIEVMEIDTTVIEEPVWEVEKRLGGFEYDARGTGPAQGRMAPRN